MLAFERTVNNDSLFNEKESDLAHLGAVKHRSRGDSVRFYVSAREQKRMEGKKSIAGCMPNSFFPFFFPLWAPDMRRDISPKT